MAWFVMVRRIRRRRRNGKKYYWRKKSLDCPVLPFPVKQMSREMAKPMVGSWNRLKKIARYLVNRKRVIWHLNWQDHTYKSHVCGDSDWGGGTGSRKSTSGGVWMIGGHCIKTWSMTQGAYALSSAEAEFIP